MKKIIINLIVLSIICSGLILSSCTKLEDENFSEIISSTFTPTNTDIGALLTPAYSSWRSVMWSSEYDAGYWLANEITADQLCIAAKPYGWIDDGMHRRMHEHTWIPADIYVSEAWYPPYAGIANCNRVMYQIESGIIPSDDAMLAELKVLRASFYYVLCDQFGNVPIVTKFDVPEGFLPEQSTRAEVYNFIVSEITSALPFLSEDRSAKTYGRFNNKWAAYALLAKIYLNAEVYSGTVQWNKCLEACEAIITSGKFGLESVQKNVFKFANENSSEIVWAIPYDVVYTSGSSSLIAITLPKDCRATFNLMNNPSGGVTAIPQFISTYNTNDLRYAKGWLMGQQYSSTGAILLCATGKLAKTPLNIINECPGIDSTEVLHGYRFYKYEIPLGTHGYRIGNDCPFFRYADILMMKAECLLRTGYQDAAAEIVSQIRQRNFPNNPELATVTGSQLLEGSSYEYGLKNHFVNTVEGGSDIMYGRFLDELGWEFAGEAHRRQDMIRFEAFPTKSWLSHSATNDPTRNIFPIPLEELNKNNNLTQNPGY
jgi:hypothetical protein